MIKAILLIWLGYGSAQVLTVDHYDSVGECRAAAKALLAHSHRLKAECLPYTVNP